MFKNVLFYFFLLFSACFFQARAQKPQEPQISKYESQVQQNKVWLDYATRFFNYTVEKGIYSEFGKVITVAEKGIALAPKNNFYSLSAYSFFLGYTHKVQLKNDSAFFYLKQSIEFGKLGGNMAYEVMAIQQLNYLNRYLGSFEQTKPYLKRLHQLLVLAKADVVKDRILSSLSEEYLSTGDYHRAISYILESLPLKEKILAQNKDYTSRVSLGLAYSSLGNLYLQLHQNQNALNNFELAKPCFAKYMGAKIRLFINFQQVYLNLGKLDSAKRYYDRVYQAMNDRKIFYANAELSAANRVFASYYLGKDIVLAKAYAEKAYQLALESDSKESMLYAFNLMGGLSYELKNYPKAIVYLEKALQGSYSFSKDVYAGSMLKLAQSYEMTGNNSKALKYYKDYNALSSKIYQDKSDEQIANIEFKYKNAEKDKQIAYLSNERLISNKLIKQKNQLQLALIIAFGLALIVAVLIYRNYRNKNKSNILLHQSNTKLDLVNKKLAEANETKAKLFSIISHDLRSPVSQLFTFLKLQQADQAYISEEEKGGRQQKLMSASTNLLATMEDLLLWSKSQMEQFELAIEEVDLAKLFVEAAQLMQGQADAKKLEINTKDLTVKSIRSDANLLTIVLRNLLQNAINHAFGPSIVYLRSGLNSDQETCIAVNNQGEVIPADQIEALLDSSQVKSKSSGYGLLIVKELAEKIGAALRIRSDAENGTEISLVFKKN